MKITEKNLIDLGFIRNDVTKEESGDDHDWHYYDFSVCQVDFITLGSNDINDDSWNVEFFNTFPPIKIKTLETLEDLIITLKSIEDEQDTP